MGNKTSTLGVAALLLSLAACKKEKRFGTFYDNTQNAVLSASQKATVKKFEHAAFIFRALLPYKSIPSYLFFFCLISLLKASAQVDPVRGSHFMRWEASVQSGLFADLFYAGIGGNERVNPPSYSTIKGRHVQLGKVDRLEIKYHLSKKAAVSLNFNYALWKDFYGLGSDPLELWTETRRYKKRLQFAANYYRNIFFRKKNELNVGIGFLIQQEQISYPFYRISPVDSSFIEVISARGMEYFPDWGFQFTGNYYYPVNKNLKVGAGFYFYLIGTAIDGAGLMASIAIPFHSARKK